MFVVSTGPVYTASESSWAALKVGRAEDWVVNASIVVPGDWEIKLWWGSGLNDDG